MLCRWSRSGVVPGWSLLSSSTFTPDLTQVLITPVSALAGDGNRSKFLPSWVKTVYRECVKESSEGRRSSTSWSLWVRIPWQAGHRFRFKPATP
jgi:hypothetical protein